MNIEILNLTQKLQNNILTIGNKDEQWWRGASIYQIYPRSFNDSNNDGIGDINGITEKLEHISNLGVDAIWLSPFFTSPMKDFGYDVSNYREVDPIFGTNKDFSKMVEKAHFLGLRIIIDQVLSHTSNEHIWFQTSSKSRDNNKSDWYVWANAKEDGTPPNNWLSIFGGSAWQWDTRRMQYYMHNFLVEQPDLNFHNREVQDTLLDDVEFWLKLGIDGFRLDTINFFTHDNLLRDNPKRSENDGPSADAPESNPYSMQNHIYDKTRPENIDFLKRFRKLLNKYPGSTSVGEVGAGNRSLEVMSEYTQDNDRIHMCYSFNFLGSDFSPSFFKKSIEEFESVVTDGWACWSFSNHDVDRHISRWNKNSSNKSDFNELCIALLISLRGSICLYQGEELGFSQADIKYKDLVDPYGITFWPEYKGRDGCRTPMAWNSNKPNGGFSNCVKPWLPIDLSHIKDAANNQINENTSIYTIYKNMLSFRENHQSLKNGSIEILYADDSLLKIKRYMKNEEIIVIFNFSNKEIEDEYNFAHEYILDYEISNNTIIKNNKINLQSFAYCFLIKKI